MNDFVRGWERQRESEKTEYVKRQAKCFYINFVTLTMIAMGSLPPKQA